MCLVTSNPASDTAVLFSGGWDSLYCYSVALRDGITPDLLFFDYGQEYVSEELAAVSSMNLPRLVTNKLPDIASSKGIFDMRNLRLLEFCQRAGYRRVYFGTRNLLPIFDKYKDSNWYWAKQQGRQLGIDIRVPTTCLPKFFIIDACRARLPDASRYVFSTEGLS